MHHDPPRRLDYLRRDFEQLAPQVTGLGPSQIVARQPSPYRLDQHKGRRVQEKPELVGEEPMAAGPPTEQVVRYLSAGREAVKLATGCAPAAPYVYYGLLGPMFFAPEAPGRDPGCLVCGEKGLLASGAPGARAWLAPGVMRRRPDRGPAGGRGVRPPSR